MSDQRFEALQVFVRRVSIDHARTYAKLLDGMGFPDIEILPDDDAGTLIETGIADVQQLETDDPDEIVKRLATAAPWDSYLEWRKFAEVDEQHGPPDEDDAVGA